MEGRALSYDILCRNSEEPVNYHGAVLLSGALAKCRYTNCLGARNLSWCRI